MAGLQRSAISFRRQGSSGIIWDDRFLSGELNQVKQKEDQDQDQEPQQQQQEQLQEQEKADNKDVKPSRTVGSINTMERSRSNGGTRGYRTGRVSPAIEPPSPKVSACGFCSAFGKPSKNRRTKPGKRRSR